MAQIPSDARVNQYTATAGQTTFTYDFKIYNNDEIRVQQNDTTLDLTTHYTVTGVGEEGGGTVVLVTGAALNDIITLTGNTMIERGTTFTQGGDFLASAINGEFNRLDNMISEVVTESSKNLKLTVYSETVSALIPNPVANKALKWNGTGTALANSTYDPDEAEAAAIAAAASAAAAVISAQDAADEAAAAVISAQDAADEAAAAAASAASINLPALAEDIIPATDNTYNLGSPTHRFATIYTNDLQVQDDISLTDNLTMYGGDISVLNGHTITADGAITSNSTISGTNIPATVQPGLQFLHVQDQKTAGTGGGTYTSGGWRKRDLTVVVSNTITGASLDAINMEIELPTGTYSIIANVPHYNVSAHIAKLDNVTDGGTYLVGQTSKSATSTIPSLITGMFSIVGGPKKISISGYPLVTSSTNGMGFPLGVIAERYTTVFLTKVA